jgi:hypothetical protein
MVPLILLAASLLPAQQASMDCADTGAQTATTETQSVRGPGGASAVLKVSSSDDHSKNSHECWADYQLLVTPASGRPPVTVDIDASDGDWGRSLSLRLAGFSNDGQHVLGILAEGGKYSLAFLFDYNTGSGQVQLVDLKMPFAHILAASCRQTLIVIGMTKAGGIVLESSSEKVCGPARQWVLDPAATKPAQPLPVGALVLPLYDPKQNVP